MPTAAKEETIGEIAEALKGSQAVIFADYRGLTVAQVGELRKQLRETGATFTVVKNTLFKIAAQDTARDDSLEKNLDGPTAASFAMKDAVATAKVFVNYVATNRNTKLSIKGGLASGKFITADQVTALSKLPAKEVLISRMLGSFNAPITNFVGTLYNINPATRFVYTLGAINSSFVYTLQAIVDQKKATQGS